MSEKQVWTTEGSTPLPNSTASPHYPQGNLSDSQATDQQNWQNQDNDELPLVVNYVHPNEAPVSTTEGVDMPSFYQPQVGGYDNRAMNQQQSAGIPVQYATSHGAPIGTAMVVLSDRAELNRAHSENSNAIMLSCFALWCCCWLLGCIAFCMAYSASERLDEGDLEGGRSGTKSSRTLSLVSIGVGCLLIVISIIAIAIVASNSSYPYFK